MITLLLFLSSLSFADLQLPFHGQSGESDRYYRPITKEYTLAQHKKIRVMAKVNEDHMARNNLHISLQCAPRVYKKIYSDASFCGLTHLSYNNSTEIITLHYTSYNPTTPAGDCSGDAYTVEVPTKEYCAPKNNQRKPEPTVGPKPTQEQNTMNGDPEISK